MQYRVAKYRIRSKYMYCKENENSICTKQFVGTHRNKCEIYIYKHNSAKFSIAQTPCWKWKEYCITYLDSKNINLTIYYVGWYWCTEHLLNITQWNAQSITICELKVEYSILRLKYMVIPSYLASHI